IGQSVRSDRPKVRQSEQRPVVLAYIAAGDVVQNLDTKSQAARQYDYFLRFYIDEPELRGKAQAALLRNDQHLTVGVVEVPPFHRTVRGVQVDPAAALRFWRAVSRER